MPSNGKNRLNRRDLLAGFTIAKSFGSEWPLKNAFRNLPPIAWNLATLQFFRKYFFLTGLAYGCHCFDMEFVGNLKFLACPIVIESLHPVHDQSLLEALQGEILPGSSAIIGMRYGRFVVILEIASRNEDDKNRCVLCPRLIRVDEQIEESLPVLRATVRLKCAPLLSVE